MQEDYYEDIIESIREITESCLQRDEEYFFAEQFDTTGHEEQIDQTEKELRALNSHRSRLESLHQQLNAKKKEKDHLKRWNIKKLRLCDEEIAAIQAKIEEEEKRLQVMLGEKSDDMLSKLAESIQTLEVQQTILSTEIKENEFQS